MPQRWRGALIVAGQETANRRSSASQLRQVERVSAEVIVDVETNSQVCAMGSVVYLRAFRGSMLLRDKEVRGIPAYMYLAAIHWV